MKSTEEQLQLRANTPQYWFNKSADLKAAAGAVWYCMDTSRNPHVTSELGLSNDYSMAVATRPVYLMLCGLSLELIYKAILVAKGQFPKARHNLRELARAAGVEVTAAESKALLLLTESIIWTGKYPTPIPSQHAAIAAVAALSADLHYDRRPLGMTFVHQPKKPDPFGWNTFAVIWGAGAAQFWEQQNDRTELR